MAGRHTVKRTLTIDKINLILKYVVANPGGGMDELIAGTGLTFASIVNTLKVMKDELHIKSERRGFGLRSTYYLRDGATITTTTKTATKKPPKWPKIPGARVVRPGEILRAKYGCVSPELRKMPRNAVKSAMD